MKTFKPTETGMVFNDMKSVCAKNLWLHFLENKFPLPLNTVELLIRWILKNIKRRGGFTALKKVFENMSPDEVIDEVKNSGIRGRGGAGFPTGIKWELVKKQKSDKKYIICNGDEGDPGAFMDRMLLESYPYRVIEGMIIAAYAAGIQQGIFLYPC